MNEQSKSKIRCPNCFVPFALKQTQFRCSNKACAPQNDLEYAHFLGVPQMMVGFVISEPGVKAIKNGSSICPQCAQDTVIHICPNCHGEVPAKPWRSPSLTLSIVGSTGAGKSVYLTVAMNNLTTNLPAILGAESGVSIASGTTRSKIQANEDLLINKGQALQTTLGKILNPDVRLPFLFNLSSWRYRSGLKPWTKKLNTFLSIYDAAGEDFNDQSDAHTLKQIPMADGLIMFIDPLSLPGFAQAIGQNQAGQHPSQILDAFYNVYVLQQGGKLNMGDKIGVPTAFILGKADSYGPWIEAQPNIKNVAEHKGGVDVQALERSSTATEAVLNQLGGNALIEVIKNRFENFHFFSVRSGTPYKDAAGNDKFQVQPFRVLDPLLWIFLQNNRVPALD